MRALVTGSAGFVGRRLVPRLARAGWQVTGTDREVDVADEAAVGAALARARPELVVHLAAVASVTAARNDPGEAYRVNFLGTRSVLAGAAREAPGARVILACTGDGYGAARPGDPPFREDAPLRPRSPYGRTKVAADLLGAEYAARGLDVVRARLFNHTGPGQSDAFVLASFARQAAEIAAGRRAPRLRVGNLDSVRDFLDVDDVLEAYVALADPKLAAGVYNVASGVPVRIGDALEAILRAAGIEAEVEVDPERMRPTDRSVGDASRLRAASGWAPRVPFSRTLERLVADWRGRVSAP